MQVLPGVGVLLVVLPMTYYFGYRIISNKKKGVQYITQRNVIVREVLPAMKLVKFYAWEPYFEKLVGDVSWSSVPFHC